jgi:hypothetical protein
MPKEAASGGISLYGSSAGGLSIIVKDGARPAPKQNEVTHD